MGLQTLRKWGHDFTWNRGDIQTLEPMGKIQMSKGKPIKLSTTHFCFFVSIVYFCQKLVEELISLGWERYRGQTQIRKTTHFGKHVFLMW